MSNPDLVKYLRDPKLVSCKAHHRKTVWAYIVVRDRTYCSVLTEYILFTRHMVRTRVHRPVSQTVSKSDDKKAIHYHSIIFSGVSGFVPSKALGLSLHCSKRQVDSPRSSYAFGLHALKEQCSSAARDNKYPALPLVYSTDSEVRSKKPPI